MKMRFNKSTVIQVSAAIAASSRWVAALLASEGIYLSDSWASWWKWVSLALAVAMSITEAAAFSYAFSRLRVTKNEAQRKIMWRLIAASAFTFVVTMTPSVVAYSQHATVAEVLSGLALWVWSIGVVLSTISVVSMIGYADSYKAEPAENTKSQTNPTKPLKSEYEIVKPQQLVAPKDEDMQGQKVISDEEFNQKMDEMGESAPNSVSAVAALFGLSHATAQRRLAARRAKNDSFA